VRILHNGCKEEKEEKKRCCRRRCRRVGSLVDGGYERACRNGRGLLRLQTNVHWRKKNENIRKRTVLSLIFSSQLFALLRAVHVKKKRMLMRRFCLLL
jgi:hypothetical protein